MRHASLTALILTALSLSACSGRPVPAAPLQPDALLTVPNPGTATDAELSAQHGGPVVLRTDQFALIGQQIQPGGLSAQSAARRAHPNRGVVRAPESVKASGTVGLWASGTVGLWASGTVGLWASGTVGLWASGTYSPLPQNTSNWQQIGLDRAHAGLSRLGSGVTVAVLDTGVDLNHPAFTGRLTQPGTWRDFVDGDATPQDEGTLTQGMTGHGTEVAGIVAQIAPGAQILPLRVLNSDGAGDVLNVARAIVYAADQGADVINLSLGAGERMPAIRAAIEYANSKGVTVSAAAGNTGERGLNYPAQDFSGSRLNLSVGSVNATDGKSSFSQYGSALAVLAPGENVYGPAPEGRLAAWSGTSMSAPVVSGAAALGLAEGYAASRVVSALRSSAADVDALSSNDAYQGELGEGRLDLAAFTRTLGK